jgi:hypothetical protein
VNSPALRPGPANGPLLLADISGYTSGAVVVVEEVDGTAVATHVFPLQA